MAQPCSKMPVALLATYLAVVTPAAALAQAFEQRAVDCARYAALLTGSATDSLWHWSLINLYDCPDHVGSTLAALWRRPPDDPVRWREVVDVSEFISDERLYAAVLRVAAAEREPVWQRAVAVTTLVAWADSTLRFSITPSPNGVGALTTSIGYGSIDHPSTRAGRQPL